MRLGSGTAGRLPALALAVVFALAAPCASAEGYIKEPVPTIRQHIAAPTPPPAPQTEPTVSGNSAEGQKAAKPATSAKPRKETSARTAEKKKASSPPASKPALKKEAASAKSQSGKKVEAARKSERPSESDSSEKSEVAGSTEAPAKSVATALASRPIRDEALDNMMAAIVKQQASKNSRSHKPEKISAAVIDLGMADDPIEPRIGMWRGAEKMYPASIVKIYYMGAAFAWARAGKLKLTPPVMKDLQYMIGPSSNTATQRMLNRICSVEPGDALSKGEFEDFKRKRNQVNDWLRGLGLKSTNANEGTWDGSPSPRDRQLLTLRLDGSGPKVNHNKTTAEDVARFLLLIASDKLVCPEDCEAMRKLMYRSTTEDRERQGYRKIFQDRLPIDTTIWGKSGYTSETSHDSAIVISPNGRKFVLVVMAETYFEHSPFLGDFAVETMKRLERLDPHREYEDSALLTGVSPRSKDETDGDSS